MIRDSGPPGTDADLLGVERVRFLDSGAVMRMAQNRPLSVAVLTGSLALHVFALLLLNWLEQAPIKPGVSLEIPVELVSDPAKSDKGAGQNVAARPPSRQRAEANAKQASATSSASAPAKSQAAQPKPQAKAQQPPASKPAPLKSAAAETQTPKPPSQPVQPKAAQTQPPQPVPRGQPKPPPPAQPTAAAQLAASARPPAATQSSSLPTTAALQMEAIHPSAALLPFSMDQNYQAVAVPSPTQNGDLLTSYKTLVFSMLELAKQFPADARARGAQGTATVYFEIDDNGGAKNVKLVQSSGDTELDVESLAVVERAAPFPKPPPGAQRAFAAEIEFDPGER